MLVSRGLCINLRVFNLYSLVYLSFAHLVYFTDFKPQNDILTEINAVHSAHLEN